jgi:hypothetical protein
MCAPIEPQLTPETRSGAAGRRQGYASAAFFLSPSPELELEPESDDDADESEPPLSLGAGFDLRP